MHCSLKISVVLVTYNQCRNLHAAINSVLGQTRKPDQIVIIDDGSTDNTIKYLSDLQQMVPNLIWNSQVHSGVGAARKKATMLADGDLIAVLDSDDIFYPGAISQYEEVFINDPELDLISGNVIIINSKGKKIKEHQYQKFENIRSFKKAIFLYPRIPFKHSSIAFTKNSYDSVGGYDENCNIKVDVDLMLRFIEHNKKIRHLNEIIAGHRIHNNNLSRYRLRGLIKWYQLIFKYEKDSFKRTNYLIAKTIWELMKLGLETSLNIIHQVKPVK